MISERFCSRCEGSLVGCGMGYRGPSLLLFALVRLVDSADCGYVLRRGPISVRRCGPCLRGSLGGICRIFMDIRSWICLVCFSFGI